ncbi:GNAT family N-acetyltransferase [Desulfospira joergensenii]|uniref:GNAT family N-acetyltransferase n=1 Tax=Desulfospira joergensenii TaxID=53329 RepID=UPI000418A864|nr:GNAT family N-acetyltransferase [Desulfospira joergensenii]
MDNLNSNISLRLMKQGEENDVVNLILNVFSEFVAPHFSNDGVLEFKKFVNNSSISERFQSGNPIIVAVFKNKIIGVIEMRDNSHIALFFVERSFQKKGIAKRLLCEAVKVVRQRNPTVQKITVNSSPNAYTAYQKFGFEGEKALKTVNGIRFIPMELKLNHSL